MKQTGFTLIEVLTVMVVLLAVASVTIETSSELAFQGRYEVTKDRYEKIKKAIIGDPNQIVNGQPNIEGFVKDMGRLPKNLHELLVRNYCDNDYRISDNTPNSTGITDASGATPKDWCESKTPNGIWTQQGPNWKGPYLTTNKPDFSPNALPDGWGSQPVAYCSDLSYTTELACIGAGKTWFTAFQNHNYGWYYFVDTSVTPNEPYLFSLGKDQLFGGGAGSLDEDYPPNPNQPVINDSDWTTPITNVTVSLQSPVQNTGCITNSVMPSAACVAANWNWFGNPECRDSSNIVTIHATETDCSAAGNTWYWFTGWPIEFCSNPAKTTKTACTTAGGTWSGDFCSVAGKKTLAECRLAEGTWQNNDWPIEDERCSDWRFTTQPSCESAGQRWFIPFCTDSTKITRPTCLAAGKKWIIPFCSTNGHEQSKSECETAGGIWGGCLDRTSSKHFCYNNGGSYRHQNLCIKIIRNSSTYISVPNQTITEDGQQFVSFPIANNIPAGQTIGMVFTDQDTTDNNCNTNPPSNTYPSANQDTICIDNLDNPNFTPANCKANGGIWVNDGTEKYCDGVIEATCTGLLAGTYHPKFQITLSPHTTLPTINW